VRVALAQPWISIAPFWEAVHMETHQWLRITCWATWTMGDDPSENRIEGITDNCVQFENKKNNML